jgi:hypothetical protein
MVKSSIKYASAVGFPLFILSDLAFKAYGRSEDPVETIFNTVKIILEQNGISSTNTSSNSEPPNNNSNNNQRQSKTNNRKSKKKNDTSQQNDYQPTANSGGLLGGINIADIARIVTETLTKEE